MSSIIIPGVSEEIAKIYLDTYNDEYIKYSFSAVIIGTETEMFQFRNCVELFAFKIKISSDVVVICFLNMVDGKATKITDEDIQVLKTFESNKTKFEEFADYAETVWSAGLSEDGPKLSDITNFHTSDTIKRMEKEHRKISIDWITSMDSIEFQQRLFRKHNIGLVLPEFVRALPGDEDYPKFVEPAKSLCGSGYPKRKLTSKDLDNNTSTFGDMNRRMLRWMSEDEFIKLSYYSSSP